MNNKTIQLLHQGKRQRIQKQDYIKLRQYNKIKSSRLSHFNDHPSEQVTQEELQSLIQQLNSSNQHLMDEISQIKKQLNKQAKINRVIIKKIPLAPVLQSDQLTYISQQNFYFKYAQSVNRAIELKKSKGYLKNLQTILELKLSIDVIELESKLEQKNQEYKKVLKSRRTNSYQNCFDELNKQKSSFVKSIYSSGNSIYLSPQIQKIKNNQKRLEDSHKQLDSRIKEKRKIRELLSKNLTELQIEVKNLENLSVEYKKSSGENSCEYIEVQNGQVRNQQDIKKQLKQIGQGIENEEKQLQNFVESKIIQKIYLIQEIQKYQLQCKKMGKRRAS